MPFVLSLSKHTRPFDKLRANGGYIYFWVLPYEVINMKLPYGIANFEKVRTEDYFYVDKTRYIELLEHRPESSVMILRSRRFGKSLFCNMLGWYYNRRHADRFEELFAGTYIADHPTPGRSSYMMLTFNFSGINTETLENANDGFTREVRSKANQFLDVYPEHFSAKEGQRVTQQPTPSDMLRELFDLLGAKGLDQSVYVVIDEYDHFANNILSQGKAMFKELVRTDGYVRPFYEALKKGTERVVDGIFITGVLPILLDSLTSGFNIGMNLSIEREFNAMFGFTEAEIAPILAHLGEAVNSEEIRTYYDGYRFSPHAEQTVYNSDMILYYGLKYDPARRQIDSMIDPNVVSDYRKIRAVLSIGERAVEEEILTRIVERRPIAVNDITQLFVLTQETEFLFDAKALVSLLFYMGYLTIREKRGLRLYLTMPNLVLESLYLEYMQAMLMTRAQIRIDGMRRDAMMGDLVEGKIDLLIELTEQMLKGLSNRDYQQFDEKYIKVVMLSLLSNVNIYIPHSEYEVSADGYVDLYLQAAFEPEQSAHYFIELKYVKARAAKQTQKNKADDGRRQLQQYLQTDTARRIPHLQAYVLVFRKDRCVQQIQPA